MSAILDVHIDEGLWNSNGGIELPLVFIASATAMDEPTEEHRAAA
ncbi:MAG: hypothetical protein WD965_00860 [Actinomycetota bacterium]